MIVFDFYVKPETGGGVPAGDGSLLAPWNGLAAIGWTGLSGGERIGALDGTYLAEFVEITKTFPAGTPVILQAVNRRAAIIDGNSVLANGVLGNGKEGVIVQGFEIRNFTGLGISFLSNSARGNSGVKLYDNEIHLCGDGASVGFPSAFADVSANTFDDVAIAYNDVHDVGGHGIAVYGPCRGAVVLRNTVARAANDPAKNTWGIYAAGDHIKHDSNPSLPSWVDEGGDVWSLDLTGTSWSSKIIEGVQFNGRTTGTGAYLLADGGVTTTPGTDEFSVTAGVVYIDAGTDDPNGKSVVLIFAHCEAVIFAHNEVSETGDGGLTGDRVGKGFDHGARLCRIDGGHSHDNGGAGVSLNTAISCVINGPYCADNGGAGVTVSTVSGTTRVHHASTSGNSQSFAFARLDVGHTIDFRNNAATEATFATKSVINGTLTEDYNVGIGALGANSVSAAATFGVLGRAVAANTAHDAGLFIAGFHDVRRDQDNIVYRASPDIGRQANVVALPTAAVIAAPNPGNIEAATTAHHIAGTGDVTATPSGEYAGASASHHVAGAGDISASVPRVYDGASASHHIAGAGSLSASVPRTYDGASASHHIAGAGSLAASQIRTYDGASASHHIAGDGSMASAAPRNIDGASASHHIAGAGAMSGGVLNVHAARMQRDLELAMREWDACLINGETVFGMIRNDDGDGLGIVTSEVFVLFPTHIVALKGIVQGTVVTRITNVYGEQLGPYRVKFLARQTGGTTEANLELLG